MTVNITAKDIAQALHTLSLAELEALDTMIFQMRLKIKREAIELLQAS